LLALALALNCCLLPGVIITPLVIRASCGNTQGTTRCHHLALPDVTNNVSSLRLSSDSDPTAADTRSHTLSSSSLLSGFRHHHYHHHHLHHPTLMSSASVDNADGPTLNSQVVVKPAYDNQFPCKHQHASSTEILPVTISKAASIDEPLEQLSLPPPLIPMPSSQPSVPSKHASSSTWTKIPSNTPRRSLPSPTPPPVPVRRSVGNVRETMLPAPPPVDSLVAETTTKTADAPLNECVVCLECAPDSVLYTCGHMCMCYSCACDVVQNRGALCPICRQSIRDVIKIFRS